MQDYVDGDKFQGDKVGRDKIINNYNLPPARVPLLAPPAPPPGFVERPTEYEQVIALLLSETQTGHVAITAALHGAGGYGKTTLAQAVCHDQRVRAAFPDGLFWVTLGERPEDLRSTVALLIWRLTGEPHNIASLAEATSALADALGGRTCLLVVDDAWSSADLHPFLQGGRSCTRLITTRDEGTLPRNTTQVPISRMQSDQALALLCNGLEKDLETNPGQWHRLAQLAARLGGWPLLLKLVNSALVEELMDTTLRRAITNILKRLDAKGLFAFDPTDTEQRRRAAAGAIEVGLERLGPKLRQRHAELAIFPEDSDIPLNVVSHLWNATDGYDTDETEELCARLQRLSLLLRYDTETRTIHLHDVVRSYLTSVHQATLPTWHKVLLDSYKQETRNKEQDRLETGNWHELPANANYLWDNLGYHLEGGRLVDELVATVCDLRYLLRKMALRDVTAAEADLTRAMSLRPTDKTLALLERRIRLYSHVLRRCIDEGEQATTLAAYLSGFPLLKSMLDQLVLLLPRPFFTSVRPIDVYNPALIRTLAAHRGNVFSGVYSPNNIYLLSTSRDATLKIWNAITGTLIDSLVGHTRAVYKGGFNPSGTRVVSASDDGTLKIWDVTNSMPIHTLTGHTDRVWSGSYNPDGTRIISASKDTTLRIWDSDSGVIIRTLIGHCEDVMSGSYSPDGLRIVSASADCTLKIWDADSGVLLHTLIGHRKRVMSGTYSPDGSKIISASVDRTLKIWDAATGLLICTLLGHNKAVISGIYKPDGSQIVSTSSDCTLKVWDSKSCELLYTLDGHSDRIWNAVYSSDGNNIVSASDDGTLKIWDAASGAAYNDLMKHNGSILSGVYSPNGNRILSASRDKTLKVWDAKKGDLVYTLTGHNAVVRSGAYNPNGTRIVSASSDKTLKVWDAASGRLICTLEGHNATVRSGTYSPDGTRIVSASSDKTLKVWDAASGRLICTLEGHNATVRSGAYSPDGTRIVSASSDKTLKVWDAASGRLICTLEGHNATVRSGAYSPDGTRIVSASEDRTLKIWDSVNGKLLHTLYGHKAPILDVKYSRDGNSIVSAGTDHMLKIWNAASKQCILTFISDGRLYWCAFAPDRHTVAAGGEDRQLYILKVEE